MGLSTLGSIGTAPPPSIAPQGASASAAAGQKRQAQAAATQAPPATPPPSEKQVQEAVKEVARVVQPKANNLQFSVDEDSGRTVVRVVDGSTGDVIRQIPSEEIMEISRNIERMQGLLVRQKA